MDMPGIYTSRVPMARLDEAQSQHSKNSNRKRHRNHREERPDRYWNGQRFLEAFFLVSAPAAGASTQDWTEHRELSGAGRMMISSYAFEVASPFPNGLP